MKRNIYIVVSVVAICVGLVVFSYTLSRAVWFSAEESEISIPTANTTSAISTSSSTTLATTTIGLPAAQAKPDEWPIHFSIPKLGIEAAVQAVGIGKSGNMAVPTNYTDVGWYRLGTAPGHIGSVVFDGHVDNGFGLSAVLKHLQEIMVGDTIVLTSKNNKTYTYQVDETEIYAYDGLPLETIFNRSDEARLVIITCDGSWIGDKETYDHRLVVYAKLLSISE